MFFFVIVLKNCTEQSCFSEVYRQQRQFIERLWFICRFAPKRVWLLQLPIAERNNDILKLQSLAFMNGHDAYSFYLVALNGLGRQCIFPFFNKVVDVGSMVLQVVVQCVVQGADVRALSF